jgi:asparagine synthase (glutamine-hydrolysing)
MCGLAGIFAYRAEAQPVDTTELLRIRERMAARGPDGSGLWVSEDRRIGLAHRRLAILDLTDAGAQPMVDDETGNRIVFNGEIYSYRELKAELEKAGHRFRSNSDTEVLLRLYAIHKAEMLGRLRGMYAFAIWDAADRSIFLARDPLGIKPLYYSDDGRTLRFASQVKALLAGGSVDNAPDAAGHAGFLLWGSVPEPYTMYRAVRALPAGCWLKAGSGRVSAPVVFDSVARRLAEASYNPDVSADAIERVAAAVRDSIAAHLVADVPVGVFLSSGLDSAMLAATASEAGPLQTVTLGFDEYAGTAIDEAPLAERLARELGTEHHTVRIAAVEFHGDRERIIEAMDQPSIDGVNVWFVSKAAAALGTKVALSGVGGDELFASYPSFADLPSLQRHLAGWAKHRALGRAMRVISAPILQGFTSPKYAGLLEYGGTLSGAYLLRRGLFMPWELPQLMEPEIARQGWQQLQVESSLDSFTTTISSTRLAISALEMGCYMRNQLLRDTDWASMAHSVEVRVPFVDINLIVDCARIFAAIPAIHKRSVAGAVTPRLPGVLLNRAKSGFQTPIREWQSREIHSRERGLRGWAKFIIQSYRT